jgi:hypothetical protein
VIARGTPGFSGADIANLVNEAALNAARYDKKKVQMVDFEYAKDKVIMGVERKSMMISDREKKNTAYHESGHTIVAAMIPAADPLHKVTIIPRGLGLTQQPLTEDKYRIRPTSKAMPPCSWAAALRRKCSSTRSPPARAMTSGSATRPARWSASKASDLGPATFGKGRADFLCANCNTRTIGRRRSRST